MSTAICKDGAWHFAAARPLNPMGVARRLISGHYNEGSDPTFGRHVAFLIRTNRKFSRLRSVKW
jgi:hypothetical protein